MLFTSKFLYNDGGEGGVGAAIELSEDVKAQLAELETLRQYKADVESREPNKSPEQIAKEAEVEKVNFKKFTVESGIMKDEDFFTLETLKQKSDRDLVFEDFKKEWEADNKDIPENEKESSLKEAFESQYHLNSDNKTLKTRGEKMLAAEASIKRNPLESSYKKAQDEYGLQKQITAEIPVFNKFLDTIIKETVTDKPVLFKTKEGEEEIPIDVELTKEQKEELNKMFRTPKYFNKYKNGKPEEVKKEIVNKINGFIKINNFDTVALKSYEAGKGIGTKQGSTVGAENLYTLQHQKDKKDEQPVDTIEKSNAKIANARTRYRRN